MSEMHALTRDKTRGKNSTTKYYNAAFVLTFEHPWKTAIWQH